MHYHDPVYGDATIHAPVLHDLLASKALQRLHHISQNGYYTPFMPGPDFSRFEHSIGVMLLLDRFGASLEEQTAGLIHDVSHSAFSHCIDYVLADSGAQQDYQDRIHDTYVHKSDIPPILAHHALSLDAVLDDTRHPLKEQPLPDLCADRIDYALRTAVHYREIKQHDAASFLSYLTIQNQRWAFRDEKSAQAFATLFRHLNTTYLSGLPSALMFRTVGDYLQYALAHTYILHEDLYTTDAAVLAKIAEHHEHDFHLHNLFQRMNRRIPYIVKSGEGVPVTICKSRAIDPGVLHEGTIKPLSALDPQWKEIIEQESQPKRYPIQFTS